MSGRPLRADAIATALEFVADDAAVVAANGHISRELHRLQDRARNFYMIGSMGLAAAIGLGIALARPERPVAIFDGDGNVLMGAGCLATIAAKRPRRFLHLCFDNERHASTGGQRTSSAHVPLERLAEAAGYAFVRRTLSLDELRSALAEAREAEGPAFVLVKVAPGGLAPGTPRVAVEPLEMTARMRRFLAGE